MAVPANLLSNRIPSSVGMLQEVIACPRLQQSSGRWPSSSTGLSKQQSCTVTAGVETTPAHSRRHGCRNNTRGSPDGRRNNGRPTSGYPSVHHGAGTCRGRSQSVRPGCFKSTPDCRNNSRAYGLAVETTASQHATRPSKQRSVRLQSSDRRNNGPLTTSQWVSKQHPLLFSLGVETTPRLSSCWYGVVHHGAGTPSPRNGSSPFLTGNRRSSSVDLLQEECGSAFISNRSSLAPECGHVPWPSCSGLPEGQSLRCRSRG